MTFNSRYSSYASSPKTRTKGLSTSPRITSPYGPINDCGPNMRTFRTRAPLGTTGPVANAPPAQDSSPLADTWRTLESNPPPATRAALDAVQSIMDDLRAPGKLAWPHRLDLTDARLRHCIQAVGGKATPFVSGLRRRLQPCVRVAH